MREINLITEKPQQTLTQEFLDENFDVETTPGFIDQLQKAKTPQEKQNLLNGIFSKQRQEKMVENSSVDISGRKVRYYRYVSWEMFIKFLQNKNLLPMITSNKSQKIQTQK